MVDGCTRTTTTTSTGNEACSTTAAADDIADTSKSALAVVSSATIKTLASQAHENINLTRDVIKQQ
jgi:hypothetical protein